MIVRSQTPFDWLNCCTEGFETISIVLNKMSKFFDTQSEFSDAPLFRRYSDDSCNFLEEFNNYQDGLEVLNNHQRSFVYDPEYYPPQVLDYSPLDSDILPQMNLMVTEDISSFSNQDDAALVQQFLPYEHRQAQRVHQSSDHHPEVAVSAASLPLTVNVGKSGAKSKRIGQKIVTEMTPVVFELIEGAGPRGTTKKHLKAALLEWLPEILQPKLRTNPDYVNRPLRQILTVLENCDKIYTDPFRRIHAKTSASPDFLEYRRSLREQAVWQANIVQQKQADVQYLRQQHQTLLHVIDFNKQRAATDVHRISSHTDGNLILEHANPDNTLKVGVTSFVVPGGKDRAIWTTDGLKTAEIASRTPFEATTILSKLTERWYPQKP